MNSLVTGFQVDSFVLVAMVTRTSVNIDAANIFKRRTPRSLACMRSKRLCPVYRNILATGDRHAFARGQASAKIAKARAERVQYSSVSVLSSQMCLQLQRAGPEIGDV